MASRKQPQMLSEGAKAPEFELQDASGARHSLKEISGGKPTLLAFYKVSCPTCQLTLPFLERIHRGRTNPEIGMYAISQDDAESTEDFSRFFKLTVPTLFDREEDEYPASNAYGISHVPSLFLVEPDGRISQANTGFDRKGMEEIGRRFGKEPFEPDESVPEWRAG